MSEHNVPAAVIPLARVAYLLVLFPAAVLKLHARPGAVRDEPYFHLRRAVPTRRTPGEGHEARRLVRDHLPDVRFCPVNIACVEASADSSFNAQIRQVLAAECRPLPPPLTDTFPERSDGRLWWSFHPDRLANRHSFSPFFST